MKGIKDSDCAPFKGGENLPASQSYICEPSATYPAFSHTDCEIQKYIWISSFANSNVSKSSDRRRRRQSIQSK